MIITLPFGNCLPGTELLQTPVNMVFSMGSLSRSYCWLITAVSAIMFTVLLIPVKVQFLMWWFQTLQLLRLPETPHWASILPHWASISLHWVPISLHQWWLSLDPSVSYECFTIFKKCFAIFYQCFMTLHKVFRVFHDV